MTQQIVLLGGQLLPVYIGIIEREPQVVHILYTKETVRLKARLINQIKGVKIFDYQTDPYDYNSIQEIVTDIICNNEGSAFELNLTSGTKLMALASLQVFKSIECFSFYIDQKQNVIDISNGTKTKLTTTISTKTILSLSNHNTFNSTTINSFGIEEIRLAKSIFELRKNKSGIGDLFKLLRMKKIDSDLIKYSLNHSKYKISWKDNELFVQAPKFNLHAKGKNSFKILTSGLWWELVVGLAINDWKSAKEILMSLAIKSNNNIKLDKNEIDILINTGQNVFFIECKSGIVTQSDINKIRTVSKFYGGISSKSILISFFKPKAHIIEKCYDLGIEIFHFNDINNKQNELNLIKKNLDKLLNKLEI